jgi:hypothetical protein
MPCPWLLEVGFDSFAGCLSMELVLSCVRAICFFARVVTLPVETWTTLEAEHHNIAQACSLHLWACWFCWTNWFLPYVLADLQLSLGSSVHKQPSVLEGGQV